MTPETALQSWIVSRLLQDAAVSGLVGASVFDEVPGDTAPELYVYVGPINRRRDPEFPTECAPRFWKITVRMFAASKDEFGRLQVWELADAIATALDRQEPVLPDPFAPVDRVMVTQGGDVINPESDKSVFLDVTVTIQQ